MPNLYQGDNGPVVIPRPPPPLTYNPGPSPRGSYSGTRSSAPGMPGPPPQPPPDIFGGYVGPEVDAARQLVQQFLTLMGFPSGWDANQLTSDLLQNGLTSNAQSAYSYMYWLGNIPNADAVRQSHPWAQYGLDAGTYQTRKDSLDSLFQSLIGQGAGLSGAWGDLGDLYRQAFVGNWSQQQVLQRLQGDSRFTQLRQDQPWLVAGQTQQQAQQQFSSLYGSAPVDTAALAGWFRFNTGTQSLNRAGREAIMTAAPQPSTSEAR